MRFLIDGHILDEVRKLVERDGDLFAAVAFWGRGAGQETGITERAQPTRILCDLLSGSCNPAEIRHLQENGVKVKYRPNLHAKVWMNGNEIVVGSANASMNGLGFETAGPNIEAAVHLVDKEIAGKVREWFLREWGLAKRVDDALLRTAEALWNQKQNTAGAIMRCHITAYQYCKMSQAAKDCFDRIAPDYFFEHKLAENHRYATEYDHPAYATCYEFGPDDVLPTPGTVYMDFSRESNGQDFEFGGFWEVIHNERLQANGGTLSLLKEKNRRKFPAPQRCRGHDGIGTMVNCYLDKGSETSLDMEFRAFYSLQQQRHCQNLEQSCENCSFTMR